ncbi:transglutaminase-like cysteine peptidase [Nitratireductor sp. ZSWI3]|uniref:transglutaminase-like cysteine peptidase n=1 Tax=Nitratireductor sp. ZSWI3 TaxID=2966359 RepID=UPI00214F8301|nr:transglutaminase-like cysteine peptidase [Nitratireductor sp. ZSWI3]MCR4267223.1 transglutaminase-like cysteine peptidase [Nitratireductor sp. ZSWI3]
MKFSIGMALAAFLASAGCSTTTESITAHSQEAAGRSGGGSRMQLVGHAFAPPAFHDFCARQARLCSTNGDGKPVELTARRSEELRRVNASVNRRIQERSDIATTGKEDDWRLPQKYGDCEDFAILKKAELMRLGWPASSLLLTVARSGGEGHTVLTVRTTRGDLILDNMNNSVKDWSNTPYRYFARQSQGNGKRWERIGAAERV